MIKKKIVSALTSSLLLICLLCPLMVQAQLEVVYPQQQSSQPRKKNSGSTLRKMAETDTIRSLPFWDDFSYAPGVPDTSLWEKSSASVRITKNIAIRPPTIGVATFDGTDANGQPHSPEADRNGSMDKLTSRPLQLGTEVVATEERNNIFLSFYWQLHGRGEGTEAGDSLRLFFLDSDSALHQVWPSSVNPVPAGAGEADFYRVTINLQEAGNRLNTNFFHDGFRFQFASTNRLSGMYDLWHVDYVHLGRGDSNGRFFTEDRALSEIQTSFLRPYTALPIDQFFAAPAKYIDTSFAITAFNLGYYDPDPDVAGEPLQYYLDIYDHNNALVHDTRPPGDTLNFPRERKGQEYYDALYTNTDLPEILAGKLESHRNNDSLHLRTVVKLEAQNRAQPYFAYNDADTIVNVLHDYFAYDDGTAEAGVAVRGGNGIRIAYQFTLETGDTLTHFDMYLPYYSQSIGGQFARISVWRSLAMEGEGGEDDLIISKEISLRNSSTINGFDRYDFISPVVLPAGTYYFGLEKQTTRDITFGFDRNTNSRDKVFVSTDFETWHAGLEEEGSLMLRPGFRQGVDPVTLGTKKPEINFPVRIFPNPSNGIFVVESEAESIAIFSSMGQLVYAEELPAGTRHQEINLHGLQPGLYLVKLSYKDGIISKKILIK